MDESTMEALLTGKRKRWFGITWGLFLAGFLLLPGVDRSIEQYRKLGELRTKVVSRSALPERARLLAERVEQMQEEMADLEVALVSADALSTFKQDVTRMARVANCRLRSIRPGPVSRRSLDDVLGKAGKGAKRSTKKPEWEVEEQISSLSIQGSYGNLLAFLSKLDNEVRVFQLASLQLHSTRETTGELVLDLDIKTFNLSRSHPG